MRGRHSDRFNQASHCWISWPRNASEQPRRRGPLPTAFVCQGSNQYLLSSYHNRVNGYSRHRSHLFTRDPLDVHRGKGAAPPQCNHSLQWRFSSCTGFLPQQQLGVRVVRAAPWVCSEMCFSVSLGSIGRNVLKTEGRDLQSAITPCPQCQCFLDFAFAVWWLPFWSSEVLLAFSVAWRIFPLAGSWLKSEKKFLSLEVLQIVNITFASQPVG